MSHLGKDKGCVVFEVDQSAADGCDGGGATAERSLAGLLGGGVYGLPPPHSRGQVRPSHPAVIPNVEVPKDPDMEVSFLFEFLCENTFFQAVCCRESDAALTRQSLR